MTAEKPKLHAIKGGEENHALGYIKLFRSIRKHWIWEDERKLKWWLDILLECNHADKKVNIGFGLIDCKRGQAVKSLLNWAKQWRVDKSSVKRFFDLLRQDGMIETENLKKTTRITVCNYGSYNDSRNAEQLKSNSKATPTQHKQECKEGKECKEDKIQELVNHPFSEVFTKEWEGWKEYKKTQHREKYKTLKTEQIAVNNLIEISGSDEQRAIKLIHNAIAKTWKGIYPIKNNPNAANQSTTKGKNSGAIDLLERARQNFTTRGTANNGS